MEHTRDLRAVGDRLEALLDALRSSAEPDVLEAAEEALGLVTELYGGGLARVMELAAAQAPGDGPGLLDAIIDDELVASLLVLHGLHPLDLAGRVQRALDKVRPYLGSHGGDVQIVGVDEDEGVVQLAMLGSCDGCPSSAVTLELAVEQAIREAAPEIVRIEVQGQPTAGEEPVAPSVHAGPAAAVATPVTLSRKPEPAAGDEPRWEPVYGLHGLVAGRLETVEIDGRPVVFCRMGKDLYAYRDSCPECGGTVHDGALEGEVLRCAGCGASYDVRRAGRSLDGHALHLDPVPLVHEGGGTVRVAVPAGAVR